MAIDINYGSSRPYLAVLQINAFIAPNEVGFTARQTRTVGSDPLQQQGA